MANRIAEAFIELKVRGEQAAKKAVESVKQSAKGLGDGFDKALGGAGEKLDKATEGARKLQGAISGILGIVTVVAAAFFKLGNAVFDITQRFKTAQERVQEFREQLRASGKDASEQADEIRKRIKELNDEIERAGSGGINIAGAEGARAAANQTRQYNKELRELSKLLNEVNFVEQARAARRAGAEQEAARKLVEIENDALQAQIDANAVALEANPIEQARLKLAQDIRDINNEILDTQRRLAEAQEDNDLNTAARLRDRLGLLQLIGKQTIDLTNAEIAALKKLEEASTTVVEGIQGAGVETARIIAEANTQAAAQTRQALLDAVSAINSQGPAFSQLEDLVASIADEVRQIRGRTP